MGDTSIAIRLIDGATPNRRPTSNAHRWGKRVAAQVLCYVDQRIIWSDVYQRNTWSIR